MRDSTMQADLLAESAGTYLGARDQHADIINQAMREREIHKDIADEFDAMLTRDKALVVERMALRSDIMSDSHYLEWVLEQYGVHQFLQGRNDNKASEGEERLAIGGVTREECFCAITRASYAYQLNRAMADLFHDELMRVAGMQP